MDISKWEILEDFGRIDRVLLVRDKVYGCSKMCTTEKMIKKKEEIMKKIMIEILIEIQK